MTVSCLINADNDDIQDTLNDTGISQSEVEELSDSSGGDMYSGDSRTVDPYMPVGEHFMTAQPCTSVTECQETIDMLLIRGLRPFQRS